MAMNEVTYIGFTPAAVDSQVADMTLNRQTGDTNNINKVSTQLIDMDAQNKDISDRTTDALVLINSQIGQITASRETILGDGTNLTAAINSVANYYNGKQSLFAGLETTASLNTKSDNIEANTLLMEPKLEALSSDVDPNSFKELYDLVMANVDVNDPDTVAGFEYSMRKSISKLADDGDQKKGSCLIYKDENTKSFYEMYIYNGLIALEEVPNPDKDVILSYLNNIVVPKPNLGIINGQIYSTIIPLTSEYFTIIYYTLGGTVSTIQAALFHIDPITKIVSKTQGQAGDELSSSANIVDLKFYKHTDNKIIVVAHNQHGTYNIENSRMLNIDLNNHISFSFSNRPQSGSDYLAHHGMCNNGSTALVISKNSNMIVICNPTTHIISSSFNLPPNYTFTSIPAFGNHSTTSILADSQYIYALVKNQYNGLAILKYLISDQSLVSELVLSNYTAYAGQNSGFGFIGGKLSVVAITNDSAQKKYLLFIDQTTMTIYPESDINHAPILLIGPVSNDATIKDLGNGKILIRPYDVTYIYTYDGYQIFSSAGNHGVLDIDALDENIIYQTYLNANETTVITNPIYKYK